MARDLPVGVCIKRGSTYRRFKVRREGRWVDLYVKLPPYGDPEFWPELKKANEGAVRGAFGDTIGIRSREYRPL